MTIPELHSNEELRQHEFPVTRNKVFFGHAGVCALPRRVSEALREYATTCTQGDQETLLPAFQLRRSRELAARLIGAKPNEIAFVGPTSLGLSFIAGGIRLTKGRNVLVYLDDYPSNVYPWMALARQGVEVRFLKVPELGHIRDSDILEQVDANTQLVALASCHYISGWRIDLPSIGTYLRKREIMFCVDGIQTVGAFPTPAEHVDFLAADAHKWMLGPCAAGILYVREEMQAQLDPTVFGWNNVEYPEFVAQNEIMLQPGARRYEVGTHNLLGLVGLNACMELLLEIGVANIALELQRKRNWLVTRLPAKGYVVLQADAPAEHSSGITSFFHADADMASLHDQLEKGNIITTLRKDRSSRQYIRLSPHFYNTDVEMERLIDLL